jgi:hypothetical protein
MPEQEFDYIFIIICLWDHRGRDPMLEKQSTTQKTKKMRNME